MHKTGLDYFFYPKTAAVIGASGERGSIGYTTFENFLHSRFKRQAFAVNPKHKTVQGKKSYASVKDIPQDIDLAVIAVPAKVVPAVFKDCIEKRVKAAIIISAGFAEIGEKKLTAQLQGLIDSSRAAKRVTRVIGPNCIGVLVPENGLDTTFFEEKRMRRPKRGGISFISQSGALGALILDWAAMEEIGIGKFVSYGNAMDVDEADLLEYLGKDPRTKVITAYLEGAKEGRKFFECARRISPCKPIIVLKGGITEEAHKATTSHTGSLAGSAQVYGAVFRQSGIVQARDLNELFAFAKLFENEPLPHGKNVQIITNGGGFGIITADAVVQSSLKLAKMSAAGRNRIKKKVPKTVVVGNPIDLTGDADSGRYVLALESALADRNVDSVIVIMLFNTPTLELGVVKELGRIRKKAKKPIAVLSLGSEFTSTMLSAIEKQGLTTFNYPTTAARALAALSGYAEFSRTGKCTEIP